VTVAAKTIREIRGQVAADSVLLAERLRTEESLSPEAGFSDLFMEAGGSETAGVDAYRLGLEYIFEGYLLHYGNSRLLEPDDPNFNLLAGDYMFARGLRAIATLEDLVGVEALAGLVRLCSFIHCEELDPALAMSAWAITTLRLAAYSRAGGHDSPGFSGLGEMIWNSGVSDTGELDAVYEQSLAAFPGKKRIELRQRFSNIYANFRAEA